MTAARAKKSLAWSWTGVPLVQGFIPIHEASDIDGVSSGPGGVKIEHIGYRPKRERDIVEQGDERWGKMLRMADQSIIAGRGGIATRSRGGHNLREGWGGRAAVGSEEPEVMMHKSRGIAPGPPRLSLDGGFGRGEGE